MAALRICILLFGLALAAQALENYIDKQEVTLEELSSLKRSDGEREFKLNAFGEELHLRLKRSDDVLPEDLTVHVHDEDDQGEFVTHDWTHKTNGAQRLYADAEKGTSVLVDDAEGKTKMSGMLTYDVLIEPDTYVYIDGDAEIETREVQVKHTIYKVERKDAATQTDDYVTVDDDTKVEETVQKRASAPQNAYVSVYVVVDYAYWKKLARSESEVIQYIKIFYNSINQLYKTIAWPYVTVSIAGITICKTSSSCTMVENAKVASDAVNAKTALDAIAKYAYDNKAKTGEDYALMMVMTDYDLCSARSGTCDRSTAGLAFVGTACNKYRYSKTSKVGIAEDHTAFDGLKTVAHEMGHILGMNHDGDGPSQTGAPGARGCRFSDNYIMGQTSFKPNQFKWSSCSVDQIRWLSTQDKADCLLKNPGNSKYPLKNKLPGKVIDLDNQCKILFGSQSKVGCNSIPPINSGDDAICQGLMCVTSSRGCRSTNAAAEGSYCGPQRYCRSGKCVCDPSAPLPTAPPKDPSCKSDTRGISFSGKSCTALLTGKDGLRSCSQSQVKRYCCASVAKYCRATPISCDGSDIPTTKFVTRPAEVFTTAKRTTLAPHTDPTDINCGRSCKDTGYTIGGRKCADYLGTVSRKKSYCDSPVVVQHCCATRSRVCAGYHYITHSCDDSCQDNALMSINGMKCVPFLSDQRNRENFCDSSLTKNHCCASRRKLCSTLIGK